MKNLLLFFCLCFLFVACNSEQPSEPELSSVTILSEKADHGHCTVTGDCSSMTCSAKIECGCDESPVCKCSWADCGCNCEKKGKLIVKYEPVYFENMNSLISLSNPSNNTELHQIQYFVFDILTSIENEDYESSSSNGKALYNFVHSMTSDEAKQTINDWFVFRGIDDEV